MRDVFAEVKHTFKPIDTSNNKYIVPISNRFISLTVPVYNTNNA